LLGGARQLLQLGPVLADAHQRGLHQAHALLPTHQVIAHPERGLDDVERIGIRDRLDPAQPGQ
jgi:hypothetical protein